jgi:hypothetical protein
MDTINPAPDLVLDEAGAKPTEQFLAEAQAAKDLALLQELNARRAKAKEQEAITLNGKAVHHIDESGAAVDEDGLPLELTEVPDEEPEPVRMPMNRAERRKQVKLYAMVLAATERQTPIVNPTIIPRAKRRRQKGGRRA